MAQTRAAPPGTGPAAKPRATAAARAARAKEVMPGGTATALPKRTSPVSRSRAALSQRVPVSRAAQAARTKRSEETAPGGGSMAKDQHAQPKPMSGISRTNGKRAGRASRKRERNNGSGPQ